MRFMMRFFPVVVVVLAELMSASALAQTQNTQAQAAPTQNVPAQNTQVQNAQAQAAPEAAPSDTQYDDAPVGRREKERGGEPPPVAEYNNVPPGLLMSGAIALPNISDDDGPQGDVMTVSDLVVAYNEGQYDLVAKHLIPIANSNYPQAEELLGIMYRDGHGVTKDPQNAVLWLTKAAEAGRPLAQHHLAIINFTGDGVAQDSVKALMWIYIAIAHYPDGDEKTRALQDRDNVIAQISRRDKLRAFDMARDWMEKHNDESTLLESPAQQH